MAVLILNALHSVVRFPLDTAFAALILTREVKRPFALAIYVAIGVARDALFLSKPWYSSFLLTVAVILINRVRPHWIVLSATSLLMYGLDLALRAFVWGARIDTLEAFLTAVAIVVVSRIYHNFKGRELVVV
ncbi:MAG: hypothetical protein GXO29_00110 [Thermotogae bacterium]|nr:hypothetical protein [Thermotogota bacterium]